MLREVRKASGKFIDNETETTLICAFSQINKEHCSTACTACKIVAETLPIRETVTCLRGSFTFANIVENTDEEFG